MSKKLTLDWYRELGWRANPFEDKILAPIEFFLSGFDDERHRINYFIIEKEPFGTIVGGMGMGKSALLQWVVTEMRKYRSRAVALYATGSELNPEVLLDRLCHAVLSKPEHVGMHSFFGLRLHKAVDYVKNKWNVDTKKVDDSFYHNIHRKDYSDLMKVKMFLHPRMKDRNVVVLVDDCGGLSEKTLGLFRELLGAQLPLQIVLAGDEEEIGIAKHLGAKDTLKIKLHELTYKQLRDLIKKRVVAVGGDDIWPLDDTTLSGLWDKAEHCPKKILKACYDFSVKQALKGVKPLKIKREERVEYDEASGFDLPSDVKAAEERGELPEHKALADIDSKKDEERSGAVEYQIRVKSSGEGTIPIDFGDSEEKHKRGGYRIREVSKEHTAVKSKPRK